MKARLPCLVRPEGMLNRRTGDAQLQVPSCSNALLRGVKGVNYFFFFHFAAAAFFARSELIFRVRFCDQTMKPR